MKVQAGRYAPTNDAVQARARATRRWLKARPEKEIVIVTHGTFLHYLTEDWEDCSKGYGSYNNSLHPLSCSLAKKKKRNEC